LQQKIAEIYNRPGPPALEDYLETVRRAVALLEAENETVRPRNDAGEPGGYLLLRPGIPTILVPDLHGRMDFFWSVLAMRDDHDRTALERLAASELQIVCLGDGFHAEGRAYQRWRDALKEFQAGYRRHRHMDKEMRESLGVMEMVMETKLRYPDCFHFLKGNHENVTNEGKEGNYPFRKYAQEGLMVLVYLRHFYGDELLDALYRFEKLLPLLAVGGCFLASHAEPATFLDRRALLDYRSLPEVVYALTWTDNDEAEPGSVEAMLDDYLREAPCGSRYYFGGHRPVQNSYRLRAEGRYVQIHDPERFVIACLPAEGDLDLDRDILEIETVEPGTIHNAEEF
jgi:hypothetical protein